MLAVLSLIGLLTLCPVLCGADEADHGSHRHGASDGTTGSQPTPVHCPEDGDSCICQGAVQSDIVHIPDADLAALPTPFASPAHTPPHPPAHMTWNGSPTGLAGWGGALAVRAFLQNFRC